MVPGIDPRGSKYPIFQDCGSKTIPSMVFGTSILEYWVLGPLDSAGAAAQPARRRGLWPMMKLQSPGFGSHVWAMVKAPVQRDSICIYLCIYLSIYLSIYLCIFVSTYLSMCIHIYTYRCVYIYICIFLQNLCCAAKRLDKGSLGRLSCNDWCSRLGFGAGEVQGFGFWGPPDVT